MLSFSHAVRYLLPLYVPTSLSSSNAVRRSRCRPAAYSLLEHNCNHFSDEVAGFLCGGRVPKHILRQPEELLSAPQRAALTSLLTQLAPTHGQVHIPHIQTD